MVLIIAGCAIQPATRALSATVWDSSNHQWITPEALTGKLATAQYVVIGEMHHSLSMRDQLLNTLDCLRHENRLKVLAIDVLKPEMASGPEDFMQQLDKAPEALADRYRPFVIWANQSNVMLLGTATPKEQLASMKTPDGQQWLAEETRGVLPERKQQYLQKS